MDDLLGGLSNPPDTTAGQGQASQPGGNQLEETFPIGNPQQNTIQTTTPQNEADQLPLFQSNPVTLQEISKDSKHVTFSEEPTVNTIPSGRNSSPGQTNHRKLGV